ncbi:cytochrome c biogenesis protein CcmG/thiol:disulfide interchange protein DsbE [Aliiruegeria haliotis]|uniref:Cytochrome c biogenesis protein CcmG/thiol:disulfide interchange protein DsbE n=1 Tax=Aliiruegeria haliotis TaxID=1280846 RepID=A0A2T0RYI6_9RHOB|nr:DsbE family thiol:disulfide interchange protein [Aliiruegeria haliotis]PRY26256.1 cytochrome c biogenesis protein CcmG/thiol:disulfide interchange protein DsbE [Aliiruegeria haliotis]
MILPPAIFAAVAGLFFAGMHRENPDSLPTALKGQQAPTLELAPLADKPLLTDEALRNGDVKLVNFWASWCAPCRVEHPQLVELAKEGIEIHGINYKDKDDKALAFLSGLGDPYTLSGTDSSGRTGLDWGVYGVPETFVVDGEGRIVTRFAGPIISSVLENTIRPAIEEARGN